MKDFDEIYQKLYNKWNISLENHRKKCLLRTIIIPIILILVGIILTFITKQFIFLCICVVIVLLNAVFSKSKKQYINEFKQKIIKGFVKQYSDSLTFEAQSGIPGSNYTRAEFERYDNYYTEDLITGQLENGYFVNMAEVKTELEMTDEEGHKTRTKIFHGLFTDVTLDKKIDTCVKIRKDVIDLYKKDKVEMDSGVFEKIYNVYSKNKIITMQLLTADIMQLLIDFKEKNKITPEITIKQNHLYIRFATGEMFEGKLIKSALDYDTLQEYYNIINFTLDLTKKFITNIKNTEL